MGRVAGKVCIVTGAASGMGKADAIMLAAEGANVVLTDLNEKDGQAVAEQIGEKAIFIKHDVSSEADWQHVVNTAVETFGRLDVLVNNAGMMALGNIVECSLEDYRRVNSVNSEGVFLGCKTAIPAMEASGNGGSIINMSSVAALHGMSFVAAYSASKGAVAALTKAVALYCREKRNGIRCNSIHPDGVKTPMVFKVATGADRRADRHHAGRDRRTGEQRRSAADAPGGAIAGDQPSCGKTPDPWAGSEDEGGRVHRECRFPRRVRLA